MSFMGFNIQIDLVGALKATTDIVASALTVGLSDNVHPIVIPYLDHLGAWLSASPRSMETIRAAMHIHGSLSLRKLGLIIGIKPVDTARLLVDCSGGMAWLTWQVALHECCSPEEVATFEQQAGQLMGLRSVPMPHIRELISAVNATAPRLGTLSFPEHFARICGAMRQAFPHTAGRYPQGVTEPAALPDVVEILVRASEAYKERTPVIIRGQRSIGWLAAILTWVYNESVEVRAAGRTVKAAEAQQYGSISTTSPIISVELTEDDPHSLRLDYRVDREGLIARLVTQPPKDRLYSFSATRCRADEYYANWLSCTSPVNLDQTGAISSAAAQLTCELLRIIRVTNVEGEKVPGNVERTVYNTVFLTNQIEIDTESIERGQGTTVRTTRGARETKGGEEPYRARKRLIDVLNLPGTYADIRQVQEFFTIPERDTPFKQTAATSQLRSIPRFEAQAEKNGIADRGRPPVVSLKGPSSIKEVYETLVQEMLNVGIHGENECHCNTASRLPSAHNSRCGIYHAASLAMELVTACMCSLFIEGPTSPRLVLFEVAPLRRVMSKAIEQSLLTGFAVITGEDLMKNVLAVAGYGENNFNYGPLIVSSKGQVTFLAALTNMALNPATIGRVVAVPGAILHRDQYYDKVVVDNHGNLGGHILGSVQGPPPRDQDSSQSISGSAAAGPSIESPNPTERPLQVSSIQPNADGAAASITPLLREGLEDIRLLIRSRQAPPGHQAKDQDLWKSITGALTATFLSECSHNVDSVYAPRTGESFCLVGTGTNWNKRPQNDSVSMALVNGCSFDRLLACGVDVNIIVRMQACIQCAVEACKASGYRHIVL